MKYKVKISKENIFLVFLLFIIPVFDTFGLLINDYFPVLILSRVLVFLMGILIIITSGFISIGIKFLILFFTVYALLSVSLHVSLFSANSIGEVASFIRLLYFPVSFFALYVLSIKQKINIDDIEKTLFRYVILIFISLFLGYISGYGGTIGGRGENIKSMKGFMIGANEVGLMLMLTAPFFISKLNSKVSFFKTHLISITLSSLAGILVFTKSSLIAIFVSVFYFIKDLKKISLWKRILVKITIMLALIITLVKLYESMGDVIDFMATSFFSSLLEKDYLGFFFRGRQNYIDAIYPQLIENKYNWLIFLFGAGEYYIRHISELPLLLDKGKGTLFEMDFFDLFAMYGSIGFVLYFAIIFIIIKTVKVNKYKLLLILVMLHSFMAGHVVFSPQVTTLISLILIINLKKNIL